ncbi:MAG: phosphoenolpyruvate--protein phosphotransferase [Bdellovibrio sp.]
MDTNDSVQKLIIKSPLTGYLFPLEEIPDPVFAQKMVGDGISIDPLEQKLVAPVHGKIAHVHSASHAVTIKTPQGIEVLIHIGIDTVKLKGKGFKSKVKVGDEVKIGDSLIEFDADYIATNAKSLLTQILVTNGEQLTVIKPANEKVSAGKDTILEVYKNNFSKETTAAKSNNLNLHDIEREQRNKLKNETAPNQTIYEIINSEKIKVLNPSGLHARPAAVLAGFAKKFNSEIKIQHKQNHGNAKSVVSILSLDIGFGDEITLAVQGPDAHDAIKTLALNISQGLNEKVENLAQPMVSPTVPPSPSPSPTSTDKNILSGVPASQGLAVGHIFQIRHQEVEVQEYSNHPRDEQQHLDRALNQAKIQLDALISHLDKQSQSDKGAIFAAHQELLEDPDLLSIATEEILLNKTAAFAWKKAYSTYAVRLSALSNELLAARANDLKDVGRRVLLLLVGNDQTHFDSQIPENAILVAENLTPSDTANLDRAKVLGFCTTTGGASSHVAILARSLGIPAVAGIHPQALEISSGTSVILDGTKGELRLNPTMEEIAAIQKLQSEAENKRQRDITHAHKSATTLDGHHVEVCANIGGLADAQKAMTLGAEGVGLLRSEFLFLNRTVAPSENEQYHVYNDIAKALELKYPLTIRTLDIGGDKPLAYLPIPQEENPFLGERGIRVSLNHPEIFREQLRGILRASAASGPSACKKQIRIMFPMISTLHEWREAKNILEEERQKLGMESVSVGIMIEVPAAAIMADAFAKEVDFFSIGTNDLTQYTLAMDRGHAKLASQADGLHPSVLTLINLTVQAAHHYGKWVGVCGGIASDTQAIPILMGLGVDELSVSVPAIPGIKSQIRSLRLSDCQKLAAQALEKSTAAEVRSLTVNQWN